MNVLISFVQQKSARLWLEYLALSLLILLPMLFPGYVLTLDLVFTPQFSLPTEVANTYPLQILLWLLHIVLPGDVIEKLMLGAILLFSGIGMHQLIEKIKTSNISSEYWTIGAYFGGIFYMINPFTYARFMAGQWMVLLGYALVPFFITAIVRLYRQPNWKNSLFLGLIALIISAVSLHHTGMLLVIAVIMTVIGIITRRVNKRISLATTGSTAVYSIGSLYWLVPFFLDKNTLSSSIHSFGAAQFQAFQTLGGNGIGAIAEVIRLQGFWVEARRLFVLPQAVVPLWGVVFLLLWALVIAGAIKAWRVQRNAVVLGIALIISGVILAATPLIAWLAPHVPFIAGYREPHKFTNLIVIGYCLLGALGVAYSLEALQKKSWTKTLGLLGLGSLVLPLIITPVMLCGFSNQLRPRQYPQEWYEMNRYLKKNASKSNILFLPWHQYANYSFSGRIIANPAEKFFDVPIISSDDPEFNNAAPTVPSEEKSKLTQAFKSKNDVSIILSRYHIYYLLVAKEQNYHDYDYLISRNVHVIHQNDKLTLYKVEGNG